ncbi:glutaminyl-peptide cyclotransferase [Pedobacter cryophilus]|uniref:Glutaminyl-peptide cyclotransferase n=1 Tax=Pedobacter cryophilus TaxID=2571271 RepID=A0A4U1BTF1_9SPHI|nr:glutaminyl-peptide cyclotransferase [Pedobacter cryophilus]TKB95769.1 glutaminyl-peptide cyclotransferase [Pedobacter cryophilus]
MTTKNTYRIVAICFLSLFIACKQKSNSNSTSSFISPESGEIVKSGQPISLRLSFTDGLVDSIQYFVDTSKVETILDTTAFQLKTENYSLGSRLITAKIFRKGISEEVTANIIIVSSKKPDQYGYQIIKTFPHSVTSYTQGLEYHDGVFYESDGEANYSSLRKVALDGTVLKQQDIDQYFAEGMTVIANKIIQLTYTEKVIFEYDRATFKLLKTIPYNHAEEGWGLAFDGETVYNTDGTNRIFLLDKNTYLPTGMIEVYDDKGPVSQLNELEWVEGKLYANIYQSELVAIINPKTGEVEAYINLIGLPKGPVDDEGNNVLNGIAYDKAGKRLFVTGKKWDKLFQIELVKQ